MKILAILALSASLCAQLPQPAFPPITTANFYGGNCNAAQWAEVPAPGSTDVQKHRMYIQTPPPVVGASIPVGSWVTHETWCESLPGGNYLAVLFIDAGPGACWNVWVQPGTFLGSPFATGNDRLMLPTAAISINPTHALMQPFNAFYYVGYQVPTSLAGYGLVSQWVRLDPSGSFYLSALRGYNIQ